MNLDKAVETSWNGVREEIRNMKKALNNYETARVTRLHYIRDVVRDNEDILVENFGNGEEVDYVHLMDKTGNLLHKLSKFVVLGDGMSKRKRGDNIYIDIGYKAVSHMGSDTSNEIVVATEEGADVGRRYFEFNKTIEKFNRVVKEFDRLPEGYREGSQVVAEFAGTRKAPRNI